MTLLATLRARRLAPELARYSEIYRESLSSIDDFQLKNLNIAWRESLKRSPWARALCSQLNAPEEFKDWETFNNIVPVLRKPGLRTLLKNTESGNCSRDIHWRSTGGTTAEPLRMPIFSSEIEISSLDIWLGRQRLGIHPQDKLFLLWGHSHLFGTGLKGVLARIQRQVSDKALGYTRWSAYRLSPTDLSHAAKALVDNGARYVLGYSTALDRFARVNMDYAPAIRRLGLRAVIATAEGFPAEDSREMLSEFFGCPVVMEYGTVETGPVAYEMASGSYDVFWAHHRLEHVDSDYPGNGKELVVTCLYPRAVPLLRYAIGDRIKTTSGNTDCKKKFKAVIGRCNDFVKTPDGTPIHSEAFTHAVRDFPCIKSYQVVRNRKHIAKCIRYEAEETLGNVTEAEIRRRLGVIDIHLTELPLERVDRIAKSIAGKSLMVVEED